MVKNTLNLVPLAKMNGKDDEMNPRMSPAMDAGNNGFQKVLLGFGSVFSNNNPN